MVEISNEDLGRGWLYIGSRICKKRTKFYTEDLCISLYANKYQLKIKRIQLAEAQGKG